MSLARRLPFLSVFGFGASICVFVIIIQLRGTFGVLAQAALVRAVRAFPIVLLIVRVCARVTRLK